MKPPRIHPLVRQCVAAGMAEHVDVDREGQPCRFASSFNQPGDALRLERLAALVDEDIRTWRGNRRSPASSSRSR